MYGDDLAAGELIAWKENQKGIVSEVLRLGRYPINAWVEGSEKRSAKPSRRGIAGRHRPEDDLLRPRHVMDGPEGADARVERQAR